MNEKEDLKRKIIKMASAIEEESYIKMIYGFVNRLYQEEKAED